MPMVRLGARPEVTELTLIPADEPGDDLALALLRSLAAKLATHAKVFGIAYANTPDPCRAWRAWRLI